MAETQILDHLFRHQYGRMVSILTRLFGLANLPLIEDAVQDTFISAMKAFWAAGVTSEKKAKTLASHVSTLAGSAISAAS